MMEICKVADENFDSVYLRYQGNLETSMEGNKFIFDSVQLMYQSKFDRVNFRRGGSYIDSLDWIRKKKNNNKSEK